MDYPPPEKEGDDLETTFASFDEKLSAQAEENRAALEIDEELETRLEKLEQKAEKIRLNRENKARQADRVRKSDKEAAQGLGNGLTIAYTIIGCPLLGAAIGWLIDRGTEGQVFMRVGVLLGAVLGVAAAVFMMNRTNDSN